MPTPQELELLALLAEEKRRNGSVTKTASASAPLPELTPDMLLSAAALREVEAAQMLSGRGYLPPQPRAAEIEQRMTAREVRAARAPIEMSLSEDMGDLDLDGDLQAPQVTANDDALLGSLFMGREAQEAVQALGGGNYAAGGGYDIEFDADSMLEGRTSPNESARFQVGRQSPPRMPFSASRMEGPSDGVVVSSRSAGGGWQRSAASRPTEPRSALAAIRETAARPAPAVPVPPPAPRPQVSRANIPTVYQRIMRGGLLGDD